MKKMWNRIILILTVAMVLSMAACSSGKDKESSKEEPATTPTTGAQVTEGAKDDNSKGDGEKKDFSYSGFNPLDYGMEPFDKPVKIKIPVFDRAIDTVPIVDDNYYTKWINNNFGKNLNVEVEFVPITRADTMGTYNLLLASDQWPTVFMEYDWDKVCQWAFDGALATYDLEEFKEVAPVWFEKAGGQEMFDLFKLSDGYTFAPALRPYWNTGHNFVVFYRKDWYEKAGLGLPKTYEEYFNAFQTFIDLGYSNGTPPLPRGPYNANFQPGNFAEWPRDEENWVMHSGVTVAPLPYEPIRNLLKRANKEFHAGFFSKEFFLDTGAASDDVANFINGNVFTYGTWLTPDMPDLRAFYEKNPDAKLGIIGGNTTVYHNGYEKGVTEVPHGPSGNPAGMYVGFSSKATEDEMKAAWLYMEWMAQPDVLFYIQNGEEGLTYTLDNDGIPVMNVEYEGEYKLGFGNNKDYWCIAVEVKTAGTMEQTLVGLAPQGLPQDFTQELIDSYHLTKMYADDGMYYPNPFFSIPIESVNLYAGNLESLFVEAATALTMCEPEEFDALYDKYAKQYLDAGYQEIMDERLQAFKDGLTTQLMDIAAGRKPFVPSDPSKIAVYE